MKFTLKKILVACAILTVVGAVAQSQADDDSDGKAIAAVRAELAKFVRGADTAEIVESPVENVYRVEVGGSYAYASVNGDYVLFGDLYNTKLSVNLGEQASNQRMAKEIDQLPADKMIVYGPEKPKRYITVFTDIDCGYCRKLHREMPELTAAGIQVRYLAFPRSGIGQDSYNKYVSVWCSDDQQTALTDAKNGKSISSKSCENPVAETYNLGRKVGVRGTPTIILDDGTITPGYIPSAQLIERLGLKG